jgi:DNA-binding PadR family transcriptional regulator
MFTERRAFGAPWRMHRFHRGDLKYVILDLIKEKPRYGYEIIRALDERSHGFYAPSPGTVYPTLQMLEEMGYISPEQQDGKKVFTITEEGRRFLEEQGDSAEQVRRHMRARWNPRDMKGPRDVMRDFSRLGRLVGRNYGRLDEERTRQVRDVLTRAHEEIDGILRE